MKRCKFCESTNNEFISLNDTVDYSGIEISLHNKGMLRCRYYEDEENNFKSQDIVNIKFCPFCGNKLKGENEK